MFAPYVPNRQDFRISPSLLGSCYFVRTPAGFCDVPVMTEDEGETAISTMIRDADEHARQLLASGAMF